MLIGIDGNEANVSQKVGLGYFAYDVLVNLHKYDQKNFYIVYLKSKPNSDLPAESEHWHYKIIGPKKFWTRLALPIHLFLQRQKLDLFYSPSHYTPLFCPCPKIASIMDLGYLDTPKQFTKKDYLQLKNWTEESIFKSKFLVSISDFTKQEIINRYKIQPEKIHLVYPCINLPIYPNLDKILKHYHLTKKQYFLYLGTLKPSKNIPFLLKSFSLYLKNNQSSIKTLVIAGKKGWLFDEIFKIATQLKLEKNLIFTDYVDDKTKWALLTNATCLVIPSLYEGFGIPALEAMLVKTAVIASNVASLPELVQGRGILINPKKEDELVQAFLDITTSSYQKNLGSISQEVSNLYSWKTTIQRLIKVFETKN